MAIARSLDQGSRASSDVGVTAEGFDHPHNGVRYDKPAY